METNTQTTVATRKIQIVTTTGEGKIYETSATKWGQLKKELSKDYHDLDRMKAIEGASKANYEHDEAVLPVGDFYLFLMPMKSKSGAKATAKAAAPAKKTAKKAAVKKAAPKKAAAKATPKKAAVAKKAASKPKAAKIKEPEETTANVADVVTSVAEAKAPVLTKSTEELRNEFNDLRKGISGVK